MDIFNHFKDRYVAKQEEEYSLEEYLEICKNDPLAYSSAPERMLHAIGEPELVDTAKDPRLSRIFSNKIIKRYPSFEEFYGMEEPIEQIVSYFKHAAQGLEERKQILYLLGPVGGGKSSLAERLKALMEKVPFFAIKDSPVYESPLGLFDLNEDGNILGRYTNGEEIVLGQLAIATFDAEGGLERSGGNLFRATLASGDPALGVPGSGTRGSTLGYALERSNVDLEDEFVDMIQAQRSYQANAGVVSTADETLQELVQLV